MHSSHVPTQLSSSNLPHFGVNRVGSIQGAVFTSGYGLFRKVVGGWERVFYEPGFTVVGFHGVSAARLFVVGSRGKRLLSGRTGPISILSIRNSNIDYHAVWTDGTEVFIVGHDGNKTFVLHGRQ